MNFLPLFFLVLLLVPSIVYAENYTVKTNNQTINITITPNNTIITNPQNSTQLENALQDVLKNQELQNSKIEKLIENATAKQENTMAKQESVWTYGDVLIGSASIVGLFSVSSFVSSRFSTDTKFISAPLLSSAIFVSGLIMVTHLYIMMSIVTGFFSKELYDLAMVITIVAVFFVATGIARIVRIENRGKRRQPRVELDREVANVSKTEEKKP